MSIAVILIELVALAALFKLTIVSQMNKDSEVFERAKSVILQGERHLMEMDCPERMVSEGMFFMDEVRKGY